MEQRTLERGALVTALVLVFARSVAEASERLGTQLLVDLVEGRELDPTGCASAPAGTRSTPTPSSSWPPRSSTAIVVPPPAPASRLAIQHRGISAEHHGDLLVLAPADDALAFGRAVREALGEQATVGVAATVVGEVPAAYDSARRAATALRALGRTGDVADDSSLGLASLLLGDASPDAVAHYIESALGPVLAHDAKRGTALLATLEAWFDHGRLDRGDRRGDARARQHRQPAAGPDRRAARPDLARAGAGAGGAGRAAAAPAAETVTPTHISTRNHGAAHHMAVVTGST